MDKSIWKALQQYIEDAAPGGSLNPEVTPQGMLDTAAASTALAPILGDIAGLAADANLLYNKPEERTLGNYGLMAAGLLPGIPGLSLMKQAGKDVASTVAHNLPNKLPNWYSGGAWGKVDSAGRLAGRGLLNTAQQYMTPTGQAMKRENFPVILKSVAEKQTKIAEDAIAAGKAKIEAIRSDPSLSEVAKDIQIQQIQQETNKVVSAAGKTIEGQRGYSDLLNKQYGTSTPIIDNAMKGTNLASGVFNKDTFKQMFPEAPEGVYERIAANQKMKDGKGVLVERKVQGQAAGDLQGDVIKKSDVAQKINAAFSKQAPATNISGFSDFRQKLEYGKLSAKEKALLDDPKMQKYLKSAFRGDSPLKSANTAEEFHSILKNSGIKIPKTLVNKAFRRTDRKPFKDMEEMINALEAEGIKIKPENKKKALEGGELIMSDSMVSGALDLGGVNIVHVVRPNGRKITYVNDENDIWGIAPPGGERLVSVASFAEDLLSPAGRKPEVFKSTAEKLEKPSPFHNMSNIQKRNTQDLVDYKAKPTLGDYGNAFKNQLLVGAGAGGLLSRFMDNEE